MLHHNELSPVLLREAVPVGSSGRIVIEIDPDLKRELYTSLEEDGLTLKQWFLEEVRARLRGHGRQLSLDLMVADGEEKDRKYG